MSGEVEARPVVVRSVLTKAQRMLRRAPRALLLFDLYQQLYVTSLGGPILPGGFQSAFRSVLKEVLRTLPRVVGHTKAREPQEVVSLMAMSLGPLLRRVDRGEDSVPLFQKISAELAEGISMILQSLGVPTKPILVLGPGRFFGLKGAVAAKGVPVEVEETFTPSEQALPKIASQPTQDLNDLYQQAAETMEMQLDLLNRGKGLDRAVGASVIRGDLKEKPNLDAPGPMVLIGPIKKQDRVLEKVKESGAGLDSVLDLVRATIAVDRLEQIPQVMQKLRDLGIVLARAPKNRFSQPTVVGYRDMMFNVRYPNGHVGEIQINVKSMLRAKKAGHPFYEQVRTIAAIKKAEGDRHLSTEEQAILDDANHIQKEIYEDAWAEVSESPLMRNASGTDSSYFEYEDLPAKVLPLELPVLLNNRGDEVVVYDVARFYREARRISKTAYNIRAQLIFQRLAKPSARNASLARIVASVR